MTDSKYAPTSDSATCDCEGCRTGDLPVNPFIDLRVAFGMLLGEDDFRTLMGNPRGKQMLHSSWLHGSGVVWGFDVVRDGVWGLRIAPGLAIDGVGRELLNEATICRDVRALLTDLVDDDKSCNTRTIEAHVVAEFATCLSSPVPTLADPCDVTRKHDDYSRVIESVRITIRHGHFKKPPRPYPRVRMFLGLDPIRPNDDAGRDVVAARRAVAERRDDRRRELLRQVRRLAAADSIEIEPARDDGDGFHTLYPIAEENSAVLLAAIEIDVRERDGCAEIMDVRLDRHVRTALLPTGTIQEMAFGLDRVAAVEEPSFDADGPQVIGDKIQLSTNGLTVTVPVTKALAVGSVIGAITVTSLSPSDGAWVDEFCFAEFDPEEHAIVVRFRRVPANDVIRIVVKGTGPKPVMSADPPVPLAGLQGGPPGSKHDGHDAVWMLPNSALKPRDPMDEPDWDDQIGTDDREDRNDEID
jgi:hypothetical protein